MEALSEMELSHVTTLAIGVPDKFVPHGSQEVLRKMLGLDAEGLYFRFRSFFARTAGARERRGAEGEGALDATAPKTGGSGSPGVTGTSGGTGVARARGVGGASRPAAG
jgi:hypothetical protein